MTTVTAAVPGRHGHRTSPTGAAGLAVDGAGVPVAVEVVDEAGDFFEGDDENGEG